MKAVELLCRLNLHSTRKINIQHKKDKTQHAAQHTTGKTAEELPRRLSLASRHGTHRAPLPPQPALNMKHVAMNALKAHHQKLCMWPPAMRGHLV
eukprot:1157899-Pelagomonas_calceolata.AAC.5